MLWKKPATVVPMSLTADGRSVLFHDGERIGCLDRNTGGLRWSSEPLAKHDMRSSGGVTIVMYDDVVLYSGLIQDGTKGHSTVTALSLADGKIAVEGRAPALRPHTPDDILVVGGLVWWGDVAQGTELGPDDRPRPAHRQGQEGDSARRADPLVPSPLLSGEGHRQLPALLADGHRVHRHRLQPLDAAPLGPRRLPVRHHALQRPDLQSAAPLRVLPRGEALRLQRPGPGQQDLPAAGGSARCRPAGAWAGLRCSVSGEAGKRMLRLNPQSPIPNPSDWPTYRHDAVPQRRHQGRRARRRCQTLANPAGRQAQQPDGRRGQGVRLLDRDAHHPRPGCRNGQARVELYGRRARRFAADGLAGTGPVRLERRLRLLPPRGRRPACLAVPRRPGRSQHDGLRAGRIGLAGAGQRAGAGRRGLVRGRPIDVPRRRPAPAAARCGHGAKALGDDFRRSRSRQRQEPSGGSARG